MIARIVRDCSSRNILHASGTTTWLKDLDSRIRRDGIGGRMSLGAQEGRHHSSTSLLRMKTIRLKHVPFFKHGRLFKVWKNMDQPSGFVQSDFVPKVVDGVPRDVENQSCWRELLMGIMKTVQSKSDLLQVVQALRSARCGTSLLDGWKKDRDQHRDDGDHDEQFNQCKARAMAIFFDQKETALTGPAVVSLNLNSPCLG